MRCTASISTVSGTLRKAFSPAVSGDGSPSLKRLTPTTICSPASIAARRFAFDSTRARFKAPLSTAAIAPPMASMRASSSRAAAFNSSTLASITREPSKMSPYSRRSVS